MSTRIMEARAVISATDKTGRVFQMIAGKMRALTQHSRTMNASMAASNHMLASSARALAPLVAPAAVGYGIKTLAGEALSFERTMIQVQKATNASGDELKAYENTILDLSRETGKTQEEIGGIMAAAAFAGRPVQDLARYTAFAAKATSAWGTNAEETGQALAEIGNIYKASQSRLEEIGDAVNYVADNAAAGEKDLIEFLRRSGAVGNQAGLSAEQTIAFGAALKEVGVGTEVAATTFNTLMSAMALGDDFLDDSKEGFKALGLNAAKVQKEFAKKPLETTVKLLERIAKISDPIKRTQVLTDLFGKEYADNIAVLTGNLGGLQKALGLVGDKTKYVGSVSSNFATSMNTDVGRIERATQAIDTLMTRAGNGFKIAGGDIAEAINGFVDATEKGENLFQKIQARNRAYNLELYGTEQSPYVTEEERQLKESADFYQGLFKKAYEAIVPSSRSAADEEGRREAIQERQRQLAQAQRIAADLMDRADSQRASGGFGLRDTERRLFFADHDLEVMRRAEQGRMTAGRPTYPWAGDDSDARGVSSISANSSLPPRPVDVTGKVEAEVKGQATVNVRVQVEGPGRVVGMDASSSGHIRAEAGTSMPHIKAGPR